MIIIYDFSNTQNAVKGSGLAMIDSARTALKWVENAGAKFLEIT